MTPEERAGRLVLSWEIATGGENDDMPLVLGGDMCDPDTDKMRADIAFTIRAAVAEEREACAIAVIEQDQIDLNAASGAATDSGSAGS